MNKVILFSEHEAYYRDLGLEDREGFEYHFGGMRLYKKSLSLLDKYDVFVCAFYTLPHNVILTCKFSAINKHTVMCTDGIFDFANALVNPMITKFQLAQFHPIIQGNFICVGQNEAQYFRRNNQINTYNYLPKRMISKNNDMPLPPQKKVLITTANTAYFNDVEYQCLCDLIVDVVLLLKEEGVDFAFRLFDDKLKVSIEEKLQTNVVNDISHAFEDTLISYSSVITTPSSIAITAMCYQRSVALLVYRDQPMILQAGWLIPSTGVLKGMLNGFISLDKERMRIQQQVVGSYVAEKNLTDYIDTIANKDNCDTQASKLEAYIDSNLMNMLNSKFNLNFEWFIRKLYTKAKGLKLMKRVRLWIK